MKTSRFLLRGFRRPREIACFALGKLERQVLEETWRLGEVSVRDVYRAFEERIAYTTLMTTLDRLFKKNLLERRKDGARLSITALVSRDEFRRGIKEDVVDGCWVTAPMRSSRCSRVSSTRSPKEIASYSTSSTGSCRRRTRDSDEVNNVRISRHHPRTCSAANHQRTATMAAAGSAD
jgi:predicted transcriptional regulator